MVPHGLARSGAAVAIGVLLALTGCARPAGVDGSLVDDWPAFAAASVPVPPVGACYDTSVRDVRAIDFDGRLSELDCAKPHSIQTVHTGRFTGETAARTTPPPAGSGPARAAFEECSKAATGYLGADWHGLRVLVRYTPPSTRQWQGGARSYRCDAVVLEGPGEILGTWTGSLKGRGQDAGLGYGCGTLLTEGDDLEGVRTTPCDEPHDAEYAGYFLARAGSYPRGTDQQTIGFDGCGKIASGFLGLTPRALDARPDPIGYLYWMVSQAEWSMGDRSVRCWVELHDGRKVKGSLKNLGNRPLPS